MGRQLQAGRLPLQDATARAASATRPAASVPGSAQTPLVVRQLSSGNPKFRDAADALIERTERQNHNRQSPHTGSALLPGMDKRDNALLQASTALVPKRQLLERTPARAEQAGLVPGAPGRAPRTPAPLPSGLDPQKMRAAPLKSRGPRDVYDVYLEEGAGRPLYKERDKLLRWDTDDERGPLPLWPVPPAR